MSARKHRLPRTSVLEKLSVDDRKRVLDFHRRTTEAEIFFIQSGYVSIEGGQEHGVKLALTRLRRINALLAS